jgi:hypothetical protein
MAFVDVMSGGKKPSNRQITFVDSRKIDAATGKPLGEGNRMGASVDRELIMKVISAAKKYGVDPAKALAMGLDESSFKPRSSYLGPDNYFELQSGDQLPNHETVGQSLKKVGNIETFMKVLKKSEEYAHSLGKNKTPEEITQAYNGYGTLKNAGILYGIDTSKNPINMGKTLMYGKKIEDIKNNIILKHPEIAALLAPKQTAPAAPPDIKPTTLASMQQTQEPIPPPQNQIPPQ